MKSATSNTLLGILGGKGGVSWQTRYPHSGVPWMKAPRPVLTIILTIALLAAPFAAAQQAGKTPRIGILRPGSPPDPLVEAFRQGLRELGYDEGRNISIEYRWAEGQLERLPTLAQELVQVRCDVIVVAGTQGIQAARQATSRIPIVIAALLVDPVGLGFVTSLSHPGGTITGLTSEYEGIVTKQVQLLTEAIPKLARLVLLRYAPGVHGPAAAAAIAADTLGLRFRVLEVKEAAELEGAFRTARDEHAQAIHVLPSPFFDIQRRLLAQLAARYRLPAMYEFREYVQDGGLMSYGVNLPDMFRRAASYVDRILKGAKPGDLPIEQPTKFELVINLKTAKTLGLTIPPSVLGRADEIIQ
jgi:putative tryptophan/tyrosine transport system substrate-binding protein